MSTGGFVGTLPLLNFMFLIYLCPVCVQLTRKTLNFPSYSSPSLVSTRLVFLVSGGPGRPPLSGHSVALSLRNRLRKEKNDFLIYKARRVDTVGEYEALYILY